MQTPNWRLFLITFISVGVSLGAGYSACVLGASFLLQMAITFGLFALFAGATIVWLGRQAKAVGGSASVSGERLRRGGLCLALLIVGGAAGFAGYALTQSRAIEIVLALAIVVPGVVALMRNDLWPDQFASPKNAGLLPGFLSVQLVLLAIVCGNFFLMLTARMTADRGYNVLREFDIASYAVFIPFIAANAMKMFAYMRSARRRGLPI